MSTKIVYFYKLSLFETKSRHEIDINYLKPCIEKIIQDNSKSGSVQLHQYVGVPIFMDIIDQNDDYLFVRLGKKKHNNGLQKRNYETYSADAVLSPIEAARNGIEIFTYCIIGYKHGIMSIARTQGAPDEKFIKQLFGKYLKTYYIETASIPNNQLIDEIYNSDQSEINHITLEIPVPNIEILEKVFGVQDKELFSAMQRKTDTVVFEIKPQKRDYILDDSSKIKSLINALRQNKNQFKKVLFNAKPTSSSRQRSYDLYEEYFKYQINVNETHQDNGIIVEYPKEKIQQDYRSEMILVYNKYKDSILAICDRL